MELLYLDDNRRDIKLSKHTVEWNQTANRVLQYLHGTLDKKLIFVASYVVQLFAYIGASYCGNYTMSLYCVWVGTQLL